MFNFICEYWATWAAFVEKIQTTTEINPYFQYDNFPQIVKRDIIIVQYVGIDNLRGKTKLR